MSSLRLARPLRRGATRPATRSLTGAIRNRELWLFGCAYLVYTVARWVFAGDPGVAQRNATAIWDLERSMGIAIEPAVQQGLDAAPVRLVLSNLYLAAQLVVLPGVVLWLYRRSRPVYRAVRTTLIATWMLSVPVFALFPVAPPRLLEGAGFADTVSDQAAVAMTGSSTMFYNAYAAVPSLHVGFAVVLGVAGVAVARRTWVKVLAAAWGPVVTLVVIATANHYVLDAVAGLAATAAGSGVHLLTARRRAPWAAASRGARERPRRPGGQRVSRHGPAPGRA